MSYTCPDCKDGVLEAKVREIPLELKDDETAEIIGGVCIVTSVACNNGCSSESEDEEEEKPKRKKRILMPAEDAKPCEKEGCIRPAGHAGSHYRKVEK